MTPPARLWALATAGLLTRLNRQDPNILGGVDPAASSAKDLGEALKRDWGISGTEDLRDRLNQLARGGHRKVFNELVTAELEPGEPRDDQAKERRRRIEFAKRHRDRIGARSLLAWDAGRLVTIAGWGAVTKMISEDEAWSYILPMAEAVQRTYGSWGELGDHYLLGREFWFGVWDPDLARVRLALLEEEGSPWRNLDWNSDLKGHGLTIPLQSVTVEAPPLPGSPASPSTLNDAGEKRPPAATMSSEPSRVPTTVRSAGGRSVVPYVVGGGLLLLILGGVGAAWALGYIGPGGASADASAKAAGSSAPAASAKPSASVPAPASAVPPTRPSPSGTAAPKGSGTKNGRKPGR